MVRELFGVALGALGQVGGAQRVVAAAHIALALAGFLLGYGVLSHDFSPLGAARRIGFGLSRGLFLLNLHLRSQARQQRRVYHTCRVLEAAHRSPEASPVAAPV